jgi:hypothetical protein
MRKTKTVYSFDNNGVFVGTDIAWESWDLNGVFLLPANSTEVAPADIPEGYFAKWDGSEWEFESIPEPVPTSEPETPITWESIRSQRNYLLSQTDWIFAPDVTLDNKEAWLTYRQTLRDVPEIFTKPEKVVWPQKPQLQKKRASLS